MLFLSLYFSSVQSLNHVWLCDAMDAACQASLSITNSRSLLKLMSSESVIPSKHLILCQPLLLLPSIFPSIRVFSNVSGLCIRWPKYWSFSFSISPSNEYSGLICIRMDWLDLLQVQGTLKSLLQHHSSKPSILGICIYYLVIEESWALKNWRFWTVVLEKALESPLDWKEIQPVHSKGDQPWDFFGRNDAKAETPVL